MKTRMASISLAVVWMLFVLGCVSTRVAGKSPVADEAFYKPEIGEQCYGTWVNHEYDSSHKAQKIVIHSWGLIEMFIDIDSKTCDQRGTSTLVERWTDHHGNVWYKDYERWEIFGSYGESAYTLLRVNRDRTTLEVIFSGVSWPNPEQMDSETNTTYLIYTRKQ